MVMGGGGQRRVTAVNPDKIKNIAPRLTNPTDDVIESWCAGVYDGGRVPHVPASQKIIERKVPRKVAKDKPSVAKENWRETLGESTAKGPAKG